MLKLIIKDFLLQKKMLYFNLAYSLFVLIVFNNSTFSSTVYIMGAVAVAYMCILGASAYDDKNKSDVILNSLPIKRKQIVEAKYFGVMAFAVLSIFTIGILGAVMKGIGLPFPERYISFTDIVGALVSLSLLSSLYFPFYFRFGYITSRIFNVIFFMVVFFAPPLMIDFLKQRYNKETIEQALTALSGQPDWLIGGILVVLAFILMFCSYSISHKFYQRREF